LFRFGAVRGRANVLSYTTNLEAVRQAWDTMPLVKRKVVELPISKDIEKRIIAAEQTANFWDMSYDEDEVLLRVEKKSSVKEAFEDTFQPLSNDEYYKRLGAVKNPDGSWDIGKGQSIPRKPLPRFPILSRSYAHNIFNVELLSEIPGRAKSFKYVVNLLEDDGVKWIEFSRLKMFPPLEYKVNTGIQAVGSYGDNLMIILETKVGVGSASFGYLGWVGKKSDIDNADGATYTSSNAAYQVLLRKIKKLHGA